MNRTWAQFAVAIVMIGAVTAISMVLLLHPGSITAESKEIVIGTSGGLMTGIGVVVHSLFGLATETKT